MKYFPFTGETYRPSVGLKTLELKDWIEIDEHWDDCLRRKTALLQQHTATVLNGIPGCDAGCLELRDILGRHLAEHFPERYRYEHGEMHIGAAKFGRAIDGLEALAQVSQWTQEDWAVLSARPPVRLEAGAICFPSRWSLKDKIGKEMPGIHQPVPKFDTIARPAQGFLERIPADKPMWRLNWTIHDSEELFCPVPHPSATDLTAENILSRTWLRIERQTLRRLPESQMVVFSIRTYMHPLAEVTADPERRLLLQQTLEKIDADTARYKGMGGFLSILLAALTQ